MERIAIVGGGIIGCSVAWELARRGASVDLFDSRPPGAGATQASAGMLVPYIEGHDAGPLRELAIRSFGLYDDFVARVSSDAAASIEYRQVGSIELAADPERHAVLRTRVEAQSNSTAEWVDGTALRELEPSVSAACTGARLVAAHRYVVVGALADALQKAAAVHGARVHGGRGVTGISTGADGARLALTDGATLPFDRVVVCAGCWTPGLALDDAAAGVVRPVRGQLLRLRWRGQPLRHILWGADCYAVPWEDGTVLVGATMEEVGYDERATVAGVRDLLDAVCDLLPDAWGATFLEARVGLRPASSDGLPVVGPSARSDRVIYATGHYRNGILLAPLTASIVGDLVIDGIADPALASLTPGRFS